MTHSTRNHGWHLDFSSNIGENVKIDPSDANSDWLDKGGKFKLNLSNNSDLLKNSPNWRPTFAATAHNNEEFSTTFPR